VAAWLRGDLAPFARDVLSAETIERQGYLDPGAVARVLEEHTSGKEDLSRQIWGLLSFTLWFDRYGREPVSAGAAAGITRVARDDARARDSATREIGQQAER
jgi:hypothetical protein